MLKHKQGRQQKQIIADRSNMVVELKQSIWKQSIIFILYANNWSNSELNCLRNSHITLYNQIIIAIIIIIYIYIYIYITIVYIDYIWWWLMMHQLYSFARWIPDFLIFLSSWKNPWLSRLVTSWRAPPGCTGEFLIDPDPRSESFYLVAHPT